MRSPTPSHQGSTHRARLATAGLLLLLGLLLATPGWAQDDALRQARYDAGASLVRAKQFARARPIARMLVADFPSWSRGWLLLGLTYTDTLEHLDIAEEAFEYAGKLDKTDPEPMRSLAAVERREGNQEKAADFLLKAADLAEDNADLQIQAAFVLRGVNRSQEARERYQIVLDQDPTDVRAVSGLGALYADLGEYAKAIDIYEKALAGADRSQLLLHNLADALVRSARYEEALKVIDESLALAEDRSMLLIRARAYIRLARYAEAEETLRAVLNDQPKGDIALYGRYFLGITRALQGCEREAVLACAESQQACCQADKEALELFKAVHAEMPDLKDVVIRLGLAQFTVGDLEDAEATLRGYVNEMGDKAEAEAFGALAVTLYRFGEKRDVDEGLRIFREARELAPDFGDGDRLEKFRQWPPQAIEVLAEIQRQADAAAAAAAEPPRRGCGCSVQGPVRNGGLAGFSLLAVIALAVRRRRRHA